MNLKKALIAVGADKELANTLAVAFSQILPGWGIRSNREVAAFLATASHESDAFTRTTENLRYTTEDALVRAFGSRMKGRTDLLKNPMALANAAYAGRIGNGDEASGDGFRFRGRGYFQLTGRGNYVAASRALGQRFDRNPEEVAEPHGAAATAAWFWSRNNLGQYANEWNLDGLREAVNGPKKLGAAEVEKLANKALKALEAKDDEVEPDPKPVPVYAQEPQGAVEGMIGEHGEIEVKGDAQAPGMDVYVVQEEDAQKDEKKSDEAKTRAKTPAAKKS